MQIYENQTINNNINHLFNTLHPSANWPDYGQNIVHRLYIYSAPNNTLSTCCFIRVILSDINIFTDMLLAKGGSNIRLFKDETSFYVYIYKSTWSRTNIEVGINWYILVAGITLTIILANIGNLILK